VVIDTTAVLEALISGLPSATGLRRAWQSGQIVPLVSRASVDELMRVLSWPGLKLSAPDQQELLADFLPYVEVVQARTVTNVPACLSLVRQAKPQGFVSLDALALSLRAQRTCSLMAPEDLLQQLAGS
jgi:predicted nucleic acid-binding protein